MKKIVLILGACLLLVVLLTGAFHRRQTAAEAHYKRNVISEYVSLGSQPLPYMPNSMVLANKQLFVTDAESNTAYVYDLGLRPIKTLNFPVVLRGLVNFSVLGDTAYAADGARTLVALNLHTSAFRVRSLRALGFSRIMPLSKDSFLLKGPDQEHGDEENDVFKVVSTSGNKPVLTHNVIRKLNDHGMNSDGFFIQAKNGTIYSVSYLNSNVYAFDKQGRYLGTLHTIGNSNKEYEVKRVGSSYTFGEPITTLNLAAGADQALYLYSRVKSVDQKKRPNDGYVDTYTLADNYVGSLCIRKISALGIKCMAVTGDTLLVAEGRQLVLYKKA